MPDVTLHTPPARLTLFGSRPTDARVEVLFRPRAWRIGRALLSLGIAWALMPVLALVPPHIPWAVLAFCAGIYLAVQRWTETYTLNTFTGECPECAEPQTIESPKKLKMPYVITCGSCRRELLLEVDVREIALATARGERPR